MCWYHSAACYQIVCDSHGFQFACQKDAGRWEAAVRKLDLRAETVTAGGGSGGSAPGAAGAAGARPTSRASPGRPRCSVLMDSRVHHPPRRPPQQAPPGGPPPDAHCALGASTYSLTGWTIHLTIHWLKAAIRLGETRCRPPPVGGPHFFFFYKLGEHLRQQVAGRGDRPHCAHDPSG